MALANVYAAYVHSGVAPYREVVGGRKQGASLSAAGAKKEEGEEDEDAAAAYSAMRPDGKEEKG